MPVTTNATINMSAGGVTITGSKSRTADSGVGYDLAIPPAKEGVLTTRTSDTAGTITLGADHGITTADTVDLYWSGGLRYGVTVGTVSGTSVPFSGGAGDDLPAEDDPITVGPVVSANVEIDGTNIIILGMQAVAPAAFTAHRAHIDFEDEAASEVQVLLTTNEPKLIDVQGGDSNPFVGEAIAVANISTSYPGGLQLRLAALIDSTP